MKYICVSFPASCISFFSYVKGANKSATRFCLVPPLTNPRNPLKRLFGAVGAGAFRRKKLLV